MPRMSWQLFTLYTYCEILAEIAYFDQPLKAAGCGVSIFHTIIICLHFDLQL